MTYQRREIEVEFTLSEGSFDQANGNILTLKNMKCELSVSAFGGLAGTTLELRLYGLSINYAAKLTGKSQKVLDQKQNLVKIKVNGEDLFVGSIVASRLNLNQMPDAPIEITATTTGYEQSLPCPDTTVKGDTKVQDLLKAIAGSVGLRFTNVDVDLVASSPHYTGNAIEQINKIAVAYNLSYYVDMGSLIVATGANPLDSITPLISPSSGLIGYPIFIDYGINFTCMFSSSIKVLRNIRLETDLPNATGIYQVLEGTTHYLSQYVEGGPWFTMVTAFPQEYLGK